MLERITTGNGVAYYRSTLLERSGIPHAFSTRSGGVSTGPFAGLNLGNPSDQPQQDSQSNIAENYNCLQSALGMAGYPRAWVRQVHGSRVDLVESENENEYGETLAATIQDRFNGQIQADALATELQGVALVIRVADCVPILFASRDGRMVAAAHAGWRGVIASVATRTVLAMQECGIPPAEIIAAIGPSICVNHFEVGPEVAEYFDKADLGAAINRIGFAKPHIDLPLALSLQLQHMGLRDIDLPADETHCTYSNAADFFSHRRDAGLTGRLAAIISRPGLVSI